MLQAVCQKLNLDFEYDAPLTFYSSQWQRSDKCLIYVIYRWLVAMFFIFSFVNSIIFSIQRNQLLISLIYLTRWNLFVTAVTCIMGAYYATLYYNGKVINRMSTGLKVYWFLCNNIILFACVISGIYWSMLYDGKTINLNNVLVHVTNSAVLILDLIFIQHPYRFSHFIYPMICGSVYELFTVVYTFSGGVDKSGKNYVYPILNWKEKPVAAIIVGTTSVICLGIMHLMVCGIHAARNEMWKCVNARFNERSDQNRKFFSIENASGCNA